MSSFWRRLSTSGDRTTQACIVNLLLVSGTISAILYFWGANNLFTHFSCIFLFWKISSPWSLKEVQKHDVATVGTAGNLDGDRMTSDWTSGNRTIKWINGIITLQVYVGIIVLDLFLVSCLNDCSKFLFEGLTICVMYFGSFLCTVGNSALAKVDVHWTTSILTSGIWSITSLSC